MPPGPAPAKGGIAAALRLHAWATGFKGRDTVHSHLLRLGRSTERGAAAAEATRSTLEAVLLQRLAPVRALRNVILGVAQRHIAAATRKPTRGDRQPLRHAPAPLLPGVLWTAVACCRRWGVPLDAHTASLLLEGMQAYATHTHHMHGRGSWQGERFLSGRASQSPPGLAADGLAGGGEAVLDLGGGAGAAAESCPVLFAQRLRLLQRWLAEDGVRPDERLILAILHACRSLAELSRRLEVGLLRLHRTEFRKALENGGAEGRAAAEQAAATAASCRATAAGTTLEALELMQGMGLPPASTHRTTACRVLTLCGDFAASGAQLEALVGGAGAPVGTAAVAAAAELLEAAAFANAEEFPRLFVRWGTVRQAPLVAVWHRLGGGHGCHACGDPSNHQRLVQAAPPLLWDHMRCGERHEDYLGDAKVPNAAFSSRFPMAALRSHPGTADCSRQMLDLLAWSREGGAGDMWRQTDLLAALQLAVRGEPHDFDELLRQVMDHDSMALPSDSMELLRVRLVHYVLRERTDAAMPVLQHLAVEGGHQGKLFLLDWALQHLPHSSQRDRLREHVEGRKRAPRQPSQ